MIHKMRLHPEPFDRIKAGIQIIEVRLNDQKRQKIKVGDQIIFLKRPEETEKMIAEVVDLLVFPSFEKLFKAVDKIKFGFEQDVTLEEQIKRMRQYYSQEEEQKYGVIGIFFKLTENS